MMILVNNEQNITTYVSGSASDNAHEKSNFTAVVCPDHPSLTQHSYEVQDNQLMFDHIADQPSLALHSFEVQDDQLVFEQVGGKVGSSSSAQ